MSEDRSAPIDLGSVFLGPKAENADVFEKLLLEAFRDHVFWRRNFHPEDGFQVKEGEKRAPAYERSISLLAQELMSLLGELKAGVPAFSPRYIGHMTSDLTMASQIGYFAAMLYNPNNVAAEASPVTSRMELEVAAQLAAMIGYPPDRQWGHLTSGGTIANFEALWVARNLKYLPVAVRWAAEEMGENVHVKLPGGEDAEIGQLDLWQLLNIEAEAALDAAQAFKAALPNPRRAFEVLGHHSLSGLGYQEFGRRLAGEFGNALPPGVVLVPSTAHYSWEKVCRAVGIGGTHLVHVPVDERFRMDPDAFAEILQGLAARRQPAIATVSVIGTTEESAVDRLDRILEARRDAARELGLWFYCHADAAWGGYAVSVTRAADGGRRGYHQTLGDGAFGWPSREVYDALVALEATDSVTIDPHKLGFVPYPAGAVSFRDSRVRDLVAVEAPYLFHGETSDAAYIGRYILEGSKPGASAVGVWMSHRVLPLDASGYGRLVAAAAHGARMLHDRLSRESWGRFRIVPLPRPDLDIVCFAIGHPEIETLEATNSFVESVHESMSVRPDQPVRQLDYLITRTTLRAEEYGPSAVPIVRALGFDEADYTRAGGLTVARCTVMNPVFAEPRGRIDYVDGFVATLRSVIEDRLAALTR